MNAVQIQKSNVFGTGDKPKSTFKKKGVLHRYIAVVENSHQN